MLGVAGIESVTLEKLMVDPEFTAARGSAGVNVATTVDYLQRL